MNTILAMQVFTNLPDYLSYIGFVAGVMLISLAGLYIFDKLNFLKKLEQNNTVAGIIFAAIGLIYSLVLAFVIVAVWNDYDELTQIVEAEADKLNSVIAHSVALQDSVKAPINAALYNYCEQVVDHEWKMQGGTVIQPSSIHGLRVKLLQEKPQDNAEKSLYAILDDNLSTISDLRRDRLSHIRSHVPSLVWLTLAAGSIIVIVFSFLLKVESPWLKRIYVAFLSGCIGMSLLLVYTLNSPFKGTMKVSTLPYENVMKELREVHPAGFQNQGLAQALN